MTRNSSTSGDDSPRRAIPASHLLRPRTRAGAARGRGDAATPRAHAATPDDRRQVLTPAVLLGGLALIVAAVALAVVLARGSSTTTKVITVHATTPPARTITVAGPSTTRNVLVPAGTPTGTAETSVIAELKPLGNAGHSSGTVTLAFGKHRLHLISSIFLPHHRFGLVLRRHHKAVVLSSSAGGRITQTITLSRAQLLRYHWLEVDRVTKHGTSSRPVLSTSPRRLLARLDRARR